MHLHYKHTLLYFVTPKDVKPASTKPKALQLLHCHCLCLDDSSRDHGKTSEGP